jgi:hypothetical protein
MERGYPCPHACVARKTSRGTLMRPEMAALPQGALDMSQWLN